MSDAGATVPLFATPFTTVNVGAVPGLDAELTRWLQSRHATAGRPGDASRDPLHSRSGDDFLASPGAAGVERLILRHATSAIAALSLTDFATLQVQARGWCSIVQRDGHVPVQHFTDAAWLAVYCAQAGEPDTGARNAGVLRLHERRLASIYRDASTASLDAPWRYGNHTWTPRPGWMALFPAHVPHEVSVVRSATPLMLVFAVLRFVERDTRDGPKG